MIIVTLTERETLKVFFKESPRAELPLGSSRITVAVASVDRDMLTRLWDEMVYRIDVCRISKGGHIEHL
jgi:hypothetical protein